MEPSLPAVEAGVVNALVKAARAGDFAAAHALIDKAEEHEQPAILELLAKNPSMPGQHRRWGIARVSFGQLALALKLPPGSVILASMDEFMHLSLMLKIEHPSLPATEPGLVLPELRCVYDAGSDSFRWEV